MRQKSRLTKVGDNNHAQSTGVELINYVVIVLHFQDLGGEMFDCVIQEMLKHDWLKRFRSV